MLALVHPFHVHLLYSIDHTRLGSIRQHDQDSMCPRKPVFSSQPSDAAEQEKRLGHQFTEWDECGRRTERAAALATVASPIGMCRP
jgi:hypothetical protein